MTEARIVLPWSVLVPDNQRHGLHRGRIKLTEKYRNALVAASAECNRQRRGMFFEQPVWVSIQFWLPDNKKRDPSNLLKLIQDALSQTVIEDDCLIYGLSWRRMGKDKENPRAEIRLWDFFQSRIVPSATGAAARTTRRVRRRRSTTGAQDD